MKLLRRHKTVLQTLGMYWPAIFALTHIPAKYIGRISTGTSDKVMHSMAYFVLVFLVWFAVSPYQKPQWKRRKVWFVLMAIIGYAAFDEFLQSFIPGRSADVWDFVADMGGLILGMGVLSVFSFWPAMLTFGAVFIFVVSNLSKILQLYPQYHLNTAFHFTAYTTFALIWIQHMDRYSGRRIGQVSWLLLSLLIPAGLLLAVKVSGVIFFEKSVSWIDAATALFGICAAILTSYAMFKLSRRKNKASL